MDVELRGVSRRFGETAALRDVSYTVPAGKFVTLLGPSGCGKTTFLRIVAGFLKPNAGDVLLGGEVITHLPSNQRQIGMVFQNYALFPHMTVERNVSFGLRMRHAPAQLVRERTSDMLDLVGLQELRDRYPHQLSGGQQQRVALARALAIQPRVLLLDEPFGALDRKLRLQMQVEVKKLIRRLGITTVFVTHDQEEALAMSDLIAVMNAGQVIQGGTPTEIYDAPHDPFVADFVGGSNFIATEVVSVDGDVALLRRGDAVFSVPVGAVLSPGQSAILVVRPENLNLRAAQNGQRGISGVVTFLRPIGALMEYEVETTAGDRLRITASRLRGIEPFSLGQPVVVTLGDPLACTVFPA